MSAAGPAIAQATIFVPMLVVVALTFVAFFHLAVARAKVAGSMPPEYYRAHIGQPEPEKARAAVRHYNNLLELPLLFYLGCVVAFMLELVDTWALVLAWGYVALRLVQSLVHMTYNAPMHRGLAFSLSVLVLLAFWAKLAMAILATG